MKFDLCFYYQVYGAKKDVLFSYAITDVFAAVSAWNNRKQQEYMSEKQMCSCMYSLVFQGLWEVVFILTDILKTFFYSVFFFLIHN